MNSIEINSIGKMYKLFDKTSDRVADVFNLNKIKFWDKTLKYKEFWALRDINLSVNKGERLGIIGRNGAGKSTLLKIITGNVQPTEGKIKVNGNIQALMQLGTGFHPEFTGIENIRTSLAYNGIGKSKIKSLEEEIIDFSELEDYINQPVKYYSAGMYSRLAFAVSTALEPDILIIDEVLGAGDAAFTTKCSERMKKLTQDTGATVLFVSHSMDSVLEICDRAILIERGRIVETGSALEVSKIYNKKIREEEELRLRAKEYKLSKKDLKNIITSDEVNNTLLFRFCCDKNHPIKKHKIYSCAITNDTKELATLDVGAPMDNDDTNINRIIDGNRFMDWDKSSKDNNGFYRYYCNKNGSNCHAPFQLSISKHYNLSDLRIKISAVIDDKESVYLEQWCHDKYLRLGELNSNEFEQCFKLHYENENTIVLEENFIEINENEDIQAQEIQIIEKTLLEDDENNNTSYIENNLKQDYNDFINSNSIYGNQQMIIESVDVVDLYNESKRVFAMGETMKFTINISPKEKIDNFTLVVNILTNTGKCAAQVFCKSEDLNLNDIDKDFIVNANFSPLRLGEGEYMVSVGIFKYCDLNDEAENEAYCIVDRAVFINVKQKETIKKCMGNFAHECKWEYGEKYFYFDATKL